MWILWYFNTTGRSYSTSGKLLDYHKKDNDKYRLYYAYMYMHGYVYGIIMYPTI